MRLTALLFTLLLAAGCATPIESGSQCVVDTGYFDDRPLFTWQQTQGLKLNDDTGYISPLIADQLKTRVMSEFELKGFRYTEDAAAADFTVALSLATRRELQSYSVDNVDCDGCWEPINPGGSVNFQMRTVGFLSVDVFAEDKPIWRGWVERNLYPKERDRAQEILEQAVPKMLEGFPP